MVEEEACEIGIWYVRIFVLKANNKPCVYNSIEQLERPAGFPSSDKIKSKN